MLEIKSLINQDRESLENFNISGEVHFANNQPPTQAALWLADPEIEIISYEPKNFAEYNSELASVLKALPEYFRLELIGNAEKIRGELEERLELANGFSRLSQEHRLALVEDIIRTVELGLAFPDKRIARVLIEKVPAFVGDYQFPYYGFHFDDKNNDRETLPVRALQTLVGTCGCYLLKDDYDRNLAEQYLLDYDKQKSRIEAAAIRARINLSDLNNKREFLTKNLIKFDHQSEFFRTINPDQVRHMKTGEVGFFKAENRTLGTQGTLPGLGHFMPIGTDRLRLIYDFGA